jgi:hypothetical protein
MNQDQKDAVENLGQSASWVRSIAATVTTDSIGALWNAVQRFEEARAAARAAFDTAPTSEPDEADLDSLGLDEADIEQLRRVRRAKERELRRADREGSLGDG